MTATSPISLRSLAMLLGIGMLAAWGPQRAAAQSVIAAESPAPQYVVEPPRPDSGRIEDHLEPQRRRRIVIGPPIPRSAGQGEIMIQPNLSVRQGDLEYRRLYPSYPLPVVASDSRSDGLPATMGASSLFQAISASPDQPLAAWTLSPQDLPGPNGAYSGSSGTPYEVVPPPPIAAEPIFGSLLDDFDQSWPESLVTADCGCAVTGTAFSNQRGLFGNARMFADIGIGHEWVMFAPFELDQTQPMNQLRFRFNSAHSVEVPDRAEFIWAKIGGPRNLLGVPEQSLDYQELRVMSEVGGAKFSVQTEIPIRAIDPVVNPNTAGLGDMSVATKTVFVDGDRWQFTQIFRTYLPTGSASHRLGTGNVAMEPGVLGRYKWSDDTYLHGEIKYCFPLGGFPGHAGQVLRYGWGVSHLLYETDRFAAIPTFEIVGWTVLDGQKTLPTGLLADVDGEYIFNVYPGIRLLSDTNGDLGPWDLGIAGGFSITNRHWYEGLLRVEMRFTY